jgi:hypothetical protein
MALENECEHLTPKKLKKAKRRLFGGKDSQYNKQYKENKTKENNRALRGRGRWGKRREGNQIFFTNELVLKSVH